MCGLRPHDTYVGLASDAVRSGYSAKRSEPNSAYVETVREERETFFAKMACPLLVRRRNHAFFEHITF